MFELLDLDEETIDELRGATEKISGRRSISCAHEVAYALAEAGFSTPCGSLQMIVRPSELTWLLWEYGLHHRGRKVQVRIITTSDTPNEHINDVRRKEITSPGRLITKIVRKPHSLAAPVVPLDETPQAAQTPSGMPVTLGIARPSAAGVKLGVVLGEQPIYSLELPDAVRNTFEEELQKPQQAYPGKLDRQTKVKRYVLFSKPVIRSIRAMLNSELETYPDTRAGAIIDMLRVSTRDRDEAFLYNYVLTGTHIWVKRLENGTTRDVEAAQWVMAKHVLLSGYSPDVRLAGEMWAYQDETGQKIIRINGNSGTYKPANERIAPAATLCEQLLGTRVEIDALPTETNN